MSVGSWDNHIAPAQHGARAVPKKSQGNKAVILRQSHGNGTMIVPPSRDGSPFSLLYSFPFLPFVLGAISAENTSKNLKLYTFGT